jgi:hypothetical protein
VAARIYRRTPHSAYWFAFNPAYSKPSDNQAGTVSTLLLAIALAGSLDARTPGRQAVDTTAILAAVSAQLREASRRSDSSVRAYCAERARPDCPERFPYRPVWYLADTADHARLAERLARLESTEHRPGTGVLPRCPWPASAPRESGYRARVSMKQENSRTVSVVLSLTCDNPPGYLHDVFRHDRLYELGLERGKWVVTSATDVIT